MKRKNANSNQLTLVTTNDPSIPSKEARVRDTGGTVYQLPKREGTTELLRHHETAIANVLRRADDLDW